MGLKRFIWTEHAELRLSDRGFSRLEIEQVVQDGHESRVANQGDADWRIEGMRSDGRRFAVIYDHPALDDPELARVVSVWTLHNPS